MTYQEMLLLRATKQASKIGCIHPKQVARELVSASEYWVNQSYRSSSSQQCIDNADKYFNKAKMLVSKYDLDAIECGTEIY